MTFGIKKLILMTLSRMTRISFSRMTFNKMTINNMALCTKSNSQRAFSKMTSSTISSSRRAICPKSHTAKCHPAKSHTAKWHLAKGRTAKWHSVKWHSAVYIDSKIKSDAWNAIFLNAIRLIAILPSDVSPAIWSQLMFLNLAHFFLTCQIRGGATEEPEKFSTFFCQNFKIFFNFSIPTSFGSEL